MERDATLEDFLDPGEHEPSATATGESGSDNHDDKTADFEERPPPTMSYRPDSGTCEACGAVVERRWRDEAGLVCSDCKRW